MSQCMGWNIIRRAADGLEVTWRTGGTGGFHSFIGLQRETGVGVVAMRNTWLEPAPLDGPMIRFIATVADGYLQ